MLTATLLLVLAPQLSTWQRPVHIDPHDVHEQLVVAVTLRLTPVARREGLEALLSSVRREAREEQITVLQRVDRTTEKRRED